MLRGAGRKPLQGVKEVDSKRSSAKISCNSRYRLVP